MVGNATASDEKFVDGGDLRVRVDVFLADWWTDVAGNGVVQVGPVLWSLLNQVLPSRAVLGTGGWTIVGAGWSVFPSG